MAFIKISSGGFYIGDSPLNPMAEITFIERTDLLIIDHTYVTKSETKKGIGLQLVQKVVEYARQENKKILPLCPYAEKVMTRTNEYQDVLLEDD